MKNNSSYFDSIRVKPKTGRKVEQLCEWKGCKLAGTHKSPKGRPHDGEYFNYCMAHAREYNKSYNYFEGMNDEENRSFRKEAQTGHRPTWKMGQRGASAYRTTRTRLDRNKGDDPFEIFEEDAPKRARRKKITAAARKAFDTMGLDTDASKTEVKAKYKSLVKLHHPDANGGTREAEERLIEIIQAYRYLREAGFC